MSAATDVLIVTVREMKSELLPPRSGCSGSDGDGFGSLERC